MMPASPGNMVLIYAFVNVAGSEFDDGATSSTIVQLASRTEGVPACGGRCEGCQRCTGRSSLFVWR